MGGMDETERRDIRRDFHEAVNMGPKELEDWLGTERSRSVGQGAPGEESVGHAMGRRIVELLRKPEDALDEDDHAAMRKVVGYVHRHCAQGGPEGDPTESRWRYSLMNWGHDPLRD
jgi:hypothetical protein